VNKNSTKNTSVFQGYQAQQMGCVCLMIFT